MIGRLVVGLCLLAIAAGGAGIPEAHALGTTRYDPCIRQAVAEWWPAGPDWLWWRAQLYQESRLEPDAVSPAGATGLAQFMPATWSDIAPALGYGTLPPTAACPAARAGAYYMARLHRFWSSPRPHMERHRLAQASYNAGAGSILAAQRRCNGARDWHEIRECLPAVTGRHARETLTYVERIARWRKLMEVVR